MHQLKDRFDENSVVVAVFHDHGSRYMEKIYNDDWMREQGFFDKEAVKVNGTKMMTA
jgi:cystathionine beta-synthase